MTETQQIQRSMPIIGQGRIPSWSQGDEDDEECDSVSWTEENEALFQQKLINIDEEMGTDDLHALKFLCQDYIAASKLESATSPLDIFGYMKKALLFDMGNTDFLIECLARLHRFDLIRKLGFDPDRAKAELPYMNGVSTFRQLLLEMAEDMDDKDLQKLKFFLSGQIKKKKLSDTKSILDMFVTMEQEEIITPQKLEGLGEIMKSIGRQDLVTVVNRHLGFIPNVPPPQFSQMGNQPQREGQTGLRVNNQTGLGVNNQTGGPCVAGDRFGQQVAGHPVFQREVTQGSAGLALPRPLVDRSPSAGTLSVTSSEGSAIEEATGGDQDCLPDHLLRQLADNLKHHFDDLGIELGFTNDEIEDFNQRFQDPQEKTRSILKKWQSRKLDKKQIGPGIKYAAQKLGHKASASAIDQWMKSRYQSHPANPDTVPQPRNTTDPYFGIHPPQQSTNKSQAQQPGVVTSVNPAQATIGQPLTNQHQLCSQENNYSSLREAQPVPRDVFDEQTQEQNITQIEALLRHINLSSAGQPEQINDLYRHILGQIDPGSDVQIPAVPQPGIQNGVAQIPVIQQSAVLNQAIIPQPAELNTGIPVQVPVQGLTGQVLPLPMPAGNQNIQIQAAPAIAADSQPFSIQTSFPEYKMDRKPRGWCVIINNREFHVERGSSDSKEMPPRVGTDRDAESIQHVFQKLGFTVQRRDNLSDTEMMQFLIDVAYNVDHSQFDCLVVFILTHGVENYVYGSNGKLVSIKDITSTFQANRCPNLAGKPKLFFLQACQGRNKMEGNEIEKDAAPVGRGKKGNTETDNKDSGKEMIPNEADFLIGYATVPGFVSFRSRNHGSWFIRKLCELLEKHGDRHDLLSILVEVNREVSHANAHIDGGVFKQTPAPLVTLRKKLYFR